MSSASIALPTATPSHPTIDNATLDEQEDLRARVLVVRVGDAEYGIPVEQVREVARADRVTRVPGAPPLVRGIVNVRGVVVTVLELSVLLDAPRAVTSSSIVLLEHGSRLIGLAVDAVRDVRAQEAFPEQHATGADGAGVVPLDAVALCAPHLLSTEEMGP